MKSNSRTLAQSARTRLLKAFAAAEKLLVPQRPKVRRLKREYERLALLAFNDALTTVKRLTVHLSKSPDVASLSSLRGECHNIRELFAEWVFGSGVPVLTKRHIKQLSDLLVTTITVCRMTRKRAKGAVGAKLFNVELKTTTELFDLMHQKVLRYRGGRTALGVAPKPDVEFTF